MIVEEASELKVEVYNCYNPGAKIVVNPNELARHNLEQTEWFLKHLIKLKPDLEEEYIEHLEKSINSFLSKSSKANPGFVVANHDEKFPILKRNRTLWTLVQGFVASVLELPSDYKSSTEEVEVLGLCRARAYDFLSYYRVKVLVNLLGKEDGTKLFKEILARIVSLERDERVDPAKKNRISFRESEQRAVEIFVKGEIGDFTFALLDDHRSLLRFDRCVTHEALKELNDPDIAYLASCYIGDIKEYNHGRRVKLRRTQTLHHGDFCDELYWDSEVHEEPEQPSLEFTRNLGRRQSRGG